MSHKLQFVLRFLDSKNGQWIIVRSADSQDIYQLRGFLLNQEVQCKPIISERLGEYHEYD